MTTPQPRPSVSVPSGSVPRVSVPRVSVNTYTPPSPVSITSRVGYSVGVGLLLVALAARFEVIPGLSDFTVLTFYPALALTALFLGRGSLPVLVGGFSGYSVFTVPEWGFKQSYDTLLPLAIYGATAVAMGVLLQRNRHLEHSRAALASVVSSTTDAVISEDVNGVITSWNKGAQWLFGYSAEEAVGQPITLIYPSSHIPTESEILAQVSRGERVSRYETTRQHKDGRPLQVSVNLSPIRDQRGRIVGVSKLAHDITQRKRLELSLSQSEMRYARLSELTFEGIAIHKNGILLDVNTALCEMFQNKYEDIVGKTFMHHFLPGYEELSKQHIDTQSRDPYHAEMVRGDRSTFWAEIRGRDCVYNGENVRVVRIHDITARKQLEDELVASAARYKEQSRTDPLTGLANRRTLAEIADQEFKRSKRFGTPTALLMIDIDHFKKINDTYGHDAGDTALVALGASLKMQARANDLPTRLGGEEFVFLLGGTELEGALLKAERIRSAAEHIVSSSPAGDFTFTISIGVSEFKETDEEWADALTRADAAMYEAKHSGRNRVVAG